MSDLHDRIAKALGWSTVDVRSFSMQSLRDLVRPVDPDLAKEMDLVIQSGGYIRGEPAAAPSPKPIAPGPSPRRSRSRRGR